MQKIIFADSHLNDPDWQREIERLHEAAAGDPQRWQARRRRQTAEGGPSGPDPLVRMGEMFLAVSPAEGRLLYLLARGTRARYIVEFGASYGISTLYLGAAARDNGGKLITTEVHPEKCTAIRATLERAGLADTATLLEGDARETLPAQPKGIDMLFLDGWKSQYLPLLERLTPLLQPGALVAADNMNHEAAQEYAEFIQGSADWFTHIIEDMAVSLYKT